MVRERLSDARVAEITNNPIYGEANSLAREVKKLRAAVAGLAELEDLRAENAELRKDRERMDKLEAITREQFIVELIRESECKPSIACISLLNGPSFDGRTLRAAVDAMPQPEPKPVCKRCGDTGLDPRLNVHHRPCPDCQKGDGDAEKA